MNLFDLIEILRYYGKHTENMSIYHAKKKADHLIKHKMIKSNIPIKKTMLKTGIILLNKTRCVY